MNKKQLFMLSAVSALIVSSFGIVSAFASNSTSVANQVQNFQNRFGITLTDAQKTQMETKKTEMETKRAAELATWQSMDIATWKQEQINKINATTQAEFDKIKERQINILKNGKGFGLGLGGERKEKPAE